MTLDEIKNELYNLMSQAKENNEVPIAALIIKDGIIISKNYNHVNSSNNILDHAEILVINETSKKLNNWRLIDCDLYTTLEPCNMCKEIIERSRINKVIYFSKQNSEKLNKEVDYEYFEDNKISNYLTNFFKSKR